MNLTRWGRNAGQVAALGHADATTILAAMSAFPDHQMVRLLRDSLFPPAGTINNNLTVQLRVRDASVRGLNPAAGGMASGMVAAAISIALMSENQRRFFRGTVLEAVVEILLRQRSERVRPEAFFDGLDTARHPTGEANRGVDLAVDEPHLELYECKTTVLDLVQGDVDVIQDVAIAASGDGRQCTPAFAGFYRQSEIQHVLATLGVRVPIFSAGMDDLARLTIGRATVMVAN